MQLYERARSGLINPCGTLYIAFYKFYDLVPFPASADTLTGFIRGCIQHPKTSFEKKLFFCMGEYAEYGFDQQG